MAAFAIVKGRVRRQMKRVTFAIGRNFLIGGEIRHGLQIEINGNQSAENRTRDQMHCALRRDGRIQSAGIRADRNDDVAASAWRFSLGENLKQDKE